MALVSRERRLAAELGLENAELRLDGDDDSDADSFPGDGRAVDTRVHVTATARGARAPAAAPAARVMSAAAFAHHTQTAGAGAVSFGRHAQSGGSGSFGHGGRKVGEGAEGGDDGGGAGAGSGGGGGGGGGPSAKALSDLVETVQRLEGELAAAVTRADGLSSQNRNNLALMRKGLIMRMREKDKLLADAVRELGASVSESCGLAKEVKKEKDATDKAELAGGAAAAAPGAGANLEDAFDATPDALRAELSRVRLLLAARTSAERVTRHKARAARAFFVEAEAAVGGGGVGGGGVHEAIASSLTRHKRAHAAAQASGNSDHLSDSDYVPGDTSPSAGAARLPHISSGSSARGSAADSAALAEARRLLAAECERTATAQAAVAKAQGEATRLREESAGLREKQAANKSAVVEAQRAAEDAAAKLRAAGDERDARERELVRVTAELSDARAALDAARSAANIAASAEARALAAELVRERDMARDEAAAARKEVAVLDAKLSDAEARATGAAAEAASQLLSAAAAREQTEESSAAVAAAEERAASAEARAAEAEASVTAARAATEAALATARAATEANASSASADAEATLARAEGAEARCVELETALSDAKAKAKADKEKLKAAAMRQFEDLKGKALDEITATKTDAEARVAAAEARIATFEASAAEMQDALSVARSAAGSVPTRLKTTVAAVSTLKTVHAGFAAAAKKEIAAMRSLLMGAGAEAARVIARQRDSQAGLMARYKKELAERRRLFNLVQELRGNIRVYCRVRPIISMEMEAGNSMAAAFPTEGEITMVNSKRVTKAWEFDCVFPPTATNDVVFKEVEGLSTSAMDGYNVCIFAYGQTGSGKTFTMEGSESSPGINFRALDHLFKTRDERSPDGVTYEISVAMLEIYNEEIRDMLGERGPDGLPLTQGKLKVHEGPTGMHVPGLTVAPVTNTEEVLNIMKQGYKSRKTFATNMNEHSSRSHAMLSVYIKGHSTVTGATTTGKLHLVDLAGSERISRSGAVGDRLKEAQAINKSLSALGDVIQARMEKQKHVPFRNSTLTFLLTDSLSGDSKTLMFVNLSPTSSNADESICSLNFAARVRATELGKASKHVSQGPLSPQPGGE